MTKQVPFILIVMLSLFFYSCASTYKPLHLNSLNYQYQAESDGLAYSYEYNILARAGNKKYSKKEDKNSIKVIAVKFKNNTNDIINFNDIQVFSGSRPLYPLMIETVGKEIKQRVGAYLFYLFLTPLKLYVGNDNGVTTYSVGYIAGPGIAFGNLLVASTANNNFKNELASYNLEGRDIHPGEVVHGLISIRDIGYQPLDFKVKKKLISETLID